MKVVFEPAFLHKVAAYHAEVARPGGTFEDPVEGLNIQQPPLHKNEMLSEREQDQHQHQQLLIDREHRATEFAPSIEKTETELGDVDAERNRMFQLAELAALGREECPSCGGRKQVYCGECVGVRMPLAEKLMPPRIALPFNILILLHW